MLAGAALVEVLLYVAQLALALRSAAPQLHPGSGFAPLPIPVVNDTGTVPQPAHGGTLIALRFALAFAQSAAALVMLRAARREPAGRWFVAIAACGMAVALASPVLMTGDVYAYTAYGLLGPAAYAPPPGGLPGAFAAIHGWWGDPVPPSVYGPVWTALCVLVVSVAHAPLAAAVGFRVAGALALLAAIALARRETPALAVMLAASPFLWWVGVTDAHNDLAGVDLALLAGALAARRPWFAALAMAGAILVKVTLILPALLAARAAASIRLRALVIVTALGIAAAGTALTAGGAFVTALRTAHRTYALVFGPVHYAFIALALAVTLAALGGRLIKGGEWAFPWTASTLFPWYLSWGLPYAVAARENAPAFVAALPLAGAALDTCYAAPPSLRFGVLALAVGVAAFGGAKDAPSDREPAAAAPSRLAR